MSLVIDTIVEIAKAIGVILLGVAGIALVLFLMFQFDNETVVLLTYGIVSLMSGFNFVARVDAREERGSWSLADFIFAFLGGTITLITYVPMLLYLVFIVLPGDILYLLSEVLEWTKD